MLRKLTSNIYIRITIVESSKMHISLIRKMKKIGILSFVFLMLLVMVGSVYAISPAAHATDSSGTVKNEFLPTVDVYGIGQFEETDYSCSFAGEACSGNVDLYVVNAKTWTGGIGELLIEVGDGIENTSVSGTCIQPTVGPLECLISMPATRIWVADTTPGEYDFAIDINQDGILGSKEPIDDALIVGFTVLPEFTTVGAALVLLGSGLYARFKRRRN